MHTEAYRHYVKRSDLTATDTAPHLTFDFPSVGAYADALAALGDKRAKGARSDSEGSPESEWAGKMSLPRAVEMGRQGGYWREAIKDMRPLPLDQARLLEGSELEVPAPAPDVQGFFPLVPNFLNGTPDAMLTMHPDPVPNKVLRIGVGVIHLASTSREAIFNRGNAILSIVDALETHAGFSCEIVAVYSAQTRGADGRRVYINVTIKRSDERWDPASVAFALCHAAFGRRLGFRWCESEPELAYMTSAGYGTTYNLESGDYDLVFNPLHGDHGFGSRAEGVETVLEASVEAIKTRAHLARDESRGSRLVG